IELQVEITIERDLQVEAKAAQRGAVDGVLYGADLVDIAPIPKDARLQLDLAGQANRRCPKLIADEDALAAESRVGVVAAHAILTPKAKLLAVEQVAVGQLAGRPGDPRQPVRQQGQAG